MLIYKLTVNGLELLLMVFLLGTRGRRVFSKEWLFYMCSDTCQAGSIGFQKKRMHDWLISLINLTLYTSSLISLF